MIAASYLQPALRNGEMILAEAVTQLTPHVEKFDAIACTGTSGLLIAPELARRLAKGLIIIRKRDVEQSHSYKTVEASIPSGRYIFVDDFTCGGGTLTRAFHAIEERLSRFTFVGAYFYFEPYTDRASERVVALGGTLFNRRAMARWNYDDQFLDGYENLESAA